MEIYYTHTYASYEKPHVENNHILLRWLIRKGYDISLLSSDDILSVINRLNNYPRPNKDYKTPLQLLEEEQNKALNAEQGTFSTELVLPSTVNVLASSSDVTVCLFSPILPKYEP